MARKASASIRYRARDNRSVAARESEKFGNGKKKGNGRAKVIGKGLLVSASILLLNTATKDDGREERKRCNICI